MPRSGVSRASRDVALGERLGPLRRSRHPRDARAALPGRARSIARAHKLCLWTRGSSQPSARSSSGAASRRRRSGSASRSRRSASRSGRSRSGSARSCSTARDGASSRPRPGCGSTAARSACSRSRSSCSRGRRRRADGELARPARARRVDRARRDVLPLLLCEFQARQPGRHGRARRLGHADGRRARRGPRARARRRRRRAAAPRRSSSSRSSATRSCSHARPAHAFAGRTVSLDELRAEPLIAHAGGRRRAAGDRGRAARAPACGCATSTCTLELGLQESVRSAVRAGYGVTFISRSAIESDLAAGTLAAARVEGLEPAREISLVRARRPDADARRPGVRRLRARAAAVTRRHPLRRRHARPSSATCSRARARARRCSSRRGAAPSRRTACRSPSVYTGVRRALPGRDASTRSSSAPAQSAPTRSSRSAAAARWTRRRRASVETRPAVRRRPDHVLGRRVDAVLRRAATRRRGRRRRRRARELRGVVYDPELTLTLPRDETAGTALNALAHCAEALYVRRHATSARSGTRFTGARRDRDTRCRCVLERPRRHLRAARAARGRDARRSRRSRGSGLALGHALAQALGAATGSRTARSTRSACRRRCASTRPVAPQALEVLGEAMATDDPIGRVEELARLGGFARLRDLGVPEDELPTVAAQAAARPGARANPRPVADAEALPSELLTARVLREEQLALGAGRDVDADLRRHRAAQAEHPDDRSPSHTGRWRKLFSIMICAASSTCMSGVAVIGSTVIHSRTRASLVCTRPGDRLHAGRAR